MSTIFFNYQEIEINHEQFSSKFNLKRTFDNLVK